MSGLSKPDPAEPVHSMRKMAKELFVSEHIIQNAVQKDLKPSIRFDPKDTLSLILLKQLKLKEVGNLSILIEDILTFYSLNSLGFKFKTKHPPTVMMIKIVAL